MESHTHSTIFCTLYPSSRSRGGSLGIVFDYGLDDQAIEVRSPEEAKRIFPPASVSRPALEPTQPPVQWVPEVLSPRVKRGRGVRLTTYPHLVSRSWVSRSYASSPPASKNVLWDCFPYICYRNSHGSWHCWFSRRPHFRDVVLPHRHEQ
jgi:hypothetical protein